jgi:hypothetical protein
MADAGKETATTPATSIELCVVLLLIGILPATVTGSKKAGNAQQLKSARTGSKEQRTCRHLRPGPIGA